MASRRAAYTTHIRRRIPRRKVFYSTVSASKRLSTISELPKCLHRGLINPEDSDVSMDFAAWPQASPSVVEHLGA